MRPLTAERSKVMLPLMGKPMLEHLIDGVKSSGIDEIIIVVGYCSDAIKSYFGDGSRCGVSIKYVTQKNQLGTADALRQVESFITSETFLVLNGDMILDKKDLVNLTALHPPVMSVSTTTHPQDFGVVTIENNLIASLEEKSLHFKSNIINAGAYLFTRDIFHRLRQVLISSRGEYELTDALAEYIDEQILTSYHLSFWMDVGYPWDLLTANEHLIQNIRPEITGIIESNVIIKGDVSIGKNTVVKSGTYIEGPVIIGENCEVGPNAYLRPGTTIGNECHIGHAVEIKNSIIFDRTKIPHYNYIGDSVIGSGCNFGAGTKIANLRHDKENVKVAGISTGRRKFGAVIGDNVLFGINCSVNTGSSIASGVHVAPGVTLSGKIEKNTVIK